MLYLKCFNDIQLEDKKYTTIYNLRLRRKIMYLILGIIVLYFVIAFASVLLPFILVAALIYMIYRIILYIKKEKYFKSEEFLKIKEESVNVVNEYNEIANYVNSLPHNISFVSDRTQFEHAHLATFENTSKHNYKRDRNTKDLNSRFVHNASLNIVRRASEDPIKYLTKYFNIEATDENLQTLESTKENISRLTNAIDNLDLRFNKLKEKYNFPNFILTHYEKELSEKLNFELPEINIDYAEYVFEYVSAGGNSSQRTLISFDEETISATAEYIAEKIALKKSSKAQRALMTKKLREYIKERDDYTCQNCSASVEEQSLLLLEVDHIIPISKGGLSIEDNLQTLCWKCNRTKSDKILL